MDGRANRSTFFVVQHKIDYMELGKQIDNYYYEHNNSPYIFMNGDTIDCIVKDTGMSPNGLHGVNTKGLCGRFQGNKVFCDNTLSFGEVEMR